MKHMSKALTLVGAGIAVAMPSLAVAAPAFAASRDGVCDKGEFCYYYNSGEQGSISDFTGSVPDYGTTQPSCYDFKGAGTGKGVCVKNNAASVRNLSTYTVRVYFDSNYAGAYQDFAPGASGDLNTTLKNEDASHRFISSTQPSCEASGVTNPRSCAAAVAWAKDHETTVYHSEYYRACDHLVALAYGRSYSGYASAKAHWAAIPSKYKHLGDRNVPAGGLAFFYSSTYGHVAISTGGVNLISNDINGNGTYGPSTISTIESRWHQTYLGWANPYFG